MNCLLCDVKQPYLPSWRGLFMNELPQMVCGKCKSGFERISGAACRICGKPGGELCKDCLAWEATVYSGMIQKGTSLFAYNKPMQEFIHQFKFLQDVLLAEVFAPEINEALRKEKAAIVPIPVHPLKLKERTFSQVDALLEASGISFIHLLEKREGMQGQKSRQERLNAEQLFTWNGEAVPKRIILVDDLYTTGTTMRHAAMALKREGAEEISLLSLVRS